MKALRWVVGAHPVCRTSNRRVYGFACAFSSPAPLSPLPRPALVQGRAVEVVGNPNSHREPVTTIEYTFRCAGPNGNDKVKAFITKAYDWYTKRMESNEDNARYM